MRTSRVITSVSILVLVLICIFAMARLAVDPGEMKIAVLFDGHTNDFRGTSLTRWRLANEGEVPVRLSRDYHIETKWKSQFYPDTRFFNPGLDFFRQGGLLRPHKSEVFTIPSVSRQGAWRAGFRFVPHGWRIQASEWVGPVSMNTPLWKLRIIRWLSPRHVLYDYSFYGPGKGYTNSEWIDEAAQPTASPNDGPAMVTAERIAP
jgi:hypothetical protein